ncbi:MAG TPA: GNAT family N-acetyltransferase [Actinoplanes sp.]
MTSGLLTRLACVSSTWTPQQRLHVGNVAWADSHGDGSSTPDATLGWGEPMVGFADIWQAGSAGTPAEATIHLSPPADDKQRKAAIQDLLDKAPVVTLEVSRQDTALVDALLANGFREAAGPWFAQLWRTVNDLSDLDDWVPADGYTIRAMNPARPTDLAERVELHRRCWDPARIKAMLGLAITGAEAGSSYSMEKHHAAMRTPVYRPELDLVAVAANGDFAAYALGWMDEQHGCVLFEPIGTDPAHTGRGLARAICSEVLRVARELGAVQAVVAPRGDAGYPVPRRLYQSLGMREVAQFVPLTNEH